MSEAKLFSVPDFIGFACREVGECALCSYLFTTALYFNILVYMYITDQATCTCTEAEQGLSPIFLIAQQVQCLPVRALGMCAPASVL